MRYPRMTAQSQRIVTVPQLNGGVNLCDLPNRVNDNQLTACNNVWWHNGTLQTRPGLSVQQEMTDLTGTVIRQQLNERETLLMQFQDKGAGVYRFCAARITIDGSEETDVQYVESIGSTSNYYEVHSDHGIPTAIGVRGQKSKTYDWLFFIDTGDIVAYKVDGGTGTWSSASPYEPLVMAKCLPQTASVSIDGVPNEAFNVLTDKFKIAYTTDATGQFFPLPDVDLANYLAVELTVSNNGAVRTVKAQLPADPHKWGYYYFLFDDLVPEEIGLSSETYAKAGVSIHFNPTKHLVRMVTYGEKSDGTQEHPANCALPVICGNNLIFHLKRAKAEKKEKICKMTKTVWFGGDRSGYDGGARLFVAGNRDEPNLLHWSDLNDPLFFPENNCAYVGEDSAPITALAKQGELLVIFLKHDIYCAQYVAGDVPTMEELKSGQATEITTHKAYFPLTQLHPNIGCDCPDTIRLVNNKLVWATGDGRVHILTATNQYSERNVREASPLIARELKKHSKAERQAAVAGEYEGYYMLLIGNRMYLLDCQTTAFNSFQYYSREETAQKSLPWYIWTLPERKYTGIVYDGNGLMIIGEKTLYILGAETDNGETIDSSFTTKLYDFSRADIKKSVDRLYVGIGDVEGCRVKVSYITEQGTAQDAYIVVCDGERHGGIRNYRLTPNVRMAEHFGIQFESKNPITVSGLTIKYKNQGVVR